MRSYGTPGASLKQMKSAYGKDSVKAGLKGEQSTAALLERWFASDDDVHVFHDLAVPRRRGEERTANIDHVVVRGTRVVVVDSKLWGPGFYWTGLRNSRRGVHRFEQADKRTVGMSVDRISKWMSGVGQPVRVWGVLLVHCPPGGKRQSLWALRAPDGVRVRSAKHAEPFLRSLLGGPTAPEPEVLRRLWELLPVGGS